MQYRIRLCIATLAVSAALSVAGCGGSTTSSSSPPPTSPSNEWTWVAGDNSVASLGTYGTKGTGSLSNSPGGRLWPSSEKDPSGGFWLFGGYGMSSSGTAGDLNDLWKYDGSNWIWVSGSIQTEQAGVYGTKGTPAVSNTPGARYQAMSRTDSTGNFWLFGGLGIDSTGTRGHLNDLWRYSQGQWAWMSGSTLSNQPGVAGQDQPGVYGTLGTPGSYNVPGARVSGTTWADSSGDLWLFGGLGVDSTGALGLLNDLWKYSGGQWTWMGGSDLVNQLGTYGNEGVPDVHNSLGARTGAVGWIDSAGNLWLFGGNGNDATGKTAGCASSPYVCELNDLWKFDGTQWTWVGGSNAANALGAYGSKGTAATANTPGARDSATAWVDGEGNFWLFGGDGFDSSGTYAGLNDLWKYSNGRWTWESGSNLAAEPGVYGNRGTASISNVPGSRDGAVGWVDNSGHLWLFGGSGLDSVSGPSGDGKLNDLWEFQQ